MTNLDAFWAITGTAILCCVCVISGWLLCRRHEHTKQAGRRQRVHRLHVTMNYIADEFADTPAGRIASRALRGFMFSGWKQYVQSMKRTSRHSKESKP